MSHLPRPTADTADQKWRQALSGYCHTEKLAQLLKDGTPEEVVTELFREVRKIDWCWREEIAKHLPQIGVMSFCGPVSTIRWLMKRVDIKPEDLALAAKLKEIEGSSELSTEEKISARLTALFPNLKL